MLKQRVTQAIALMNKAKDILAGKTKRSVDNVDQIAVLADEMRGLFAEALMNGGTMKETDLYIKAATQLQLRCVRSGVRVKA